MGDIGLEPELRARIRVGSLGPCSTSPAPAPAAGLLVPIQLVKMLVMVMVLEMDDAV